MYMYSNGTYSMMGYELSDDLGMCGVYSVSLPGSPRVLADLSVNQ